MDLLVSQAILAAPLFLMVLVGYLAMKLFRWPVKVAAVASKLVFTVAIPMLLFHWMSDFSRFPPADARILVAFFGGCLVVFFVGRWAGMRFLGVDKSSGAILGIGGVFSNNIMLGLPLSQILLGAAAVPTVALVLVFNALILWSLVTVAIEWARHGALSWKGLVGLPK